MLKSVRKCTRGDLKQCGVRFDEYSPNLIEKSSRKIVIVMMLVDEAEAKPHGGFLARAFLAPTAPVGRTKGREIASPHAKERNGRARERGLAHETNVSPLINLASHGIPASRLRPVRAQLHFLEAG
jgi:hypothetical protein